jgi:hypothetical protein
MQCKILKDYHIQHNEMFHFHVKCCGCDVNSHQHTQTGDDDEGSKICKLCLLTVLVEPLST